MHCRCAEYVFSVNYPVYDNYEGIWVVEERYKHHNRSHAPEQNDQTKDTVPRLKLDPIVLHEQVRRLEADGLVDGDYWSWPTFGHFRHTF